MLLSKISISFGEPASASAATNFSDPKVMGAIALVLVAAAAIGVGVHKWLAPNAYATTLAFLAACGFVGILAYAGVPAAGYIVTAMVIVMLIVWALTMFANS